MLEKLLHNRRVIDGDKGLMVEDGDGGSSTENGMEGGDINIIVKVGGTGVGGGGRCTRGWVNAMFAAEILALRRSEGSCNRRFMANISGNGGFHRTRGRLD